MGRPGEASNPDFAFLGAVVNDARKNGGLTLPTPGSASLRELGNVLSSSAKDLVRSGRMALQSGDLKAAKEIANEALRRDPNSVEASSLREAIREGNADKSTSTHKPRYKLVAFQGQPPQSNQEGIAVPAANNVFVPQAPISQNINELSTAGDLLASEEEMRRVEAQRIEAEVQNDLRETVGLLRRDPLRRSLD